MKGSNLALTSGLIGFLLGWFVFELIPNRAIIYRLSPDENLRVKIIEIQQDFDRLIELRLERINDPQKTKTIYISGNENYAAGSEHIIWSSDSSRFILVGRHFNVRVSGNNVFLPTGEYIYLMYERKSGKLSCNTYVPEWCDIGPKQIKTSSGHYTTTSEPIITIDDLLHYEWESPLIEACPIPSPAKK